MWCGFVRVCAALNATNEQAEVCRSRFRRIHAIADFKQAHALDPTNTTYDSDLSTAILANAGS